MTLRKNVPPGSTVPTGPSVLSQFLSEWYPISFNHDFPSKLRSCSLVRVRSDTLGVQQQGAQRHEEAEMKYVITGGSGYIGGRLIDLILGRGDAEIVNVDIGRPSVPRPRTPLHADGHPRPRHGALVRGGAGRCARAPRLRAQPDAGRADDVRHRRQRHTERARRRIRAGAAGARGFQHDRLWRLAGQPGPSDRGRPGARDAELRVRPRQDRDRPDLPAVGRPAPGPDHDDRAPDDRVRPERRQLHHPLLAKLPVHRADRRRRPRHAVRPRGRRRGGALAAACSSGRAGSST